MTETTPPRAGGYPLVGIAPQYVRDPFATMDSVAALGNVVAYRLLHRRFVGVYHPEPAERVLVTEDSKFEKPDLLRQSGVEFLENGLFLSEGEQWQRQRNLLQPMFYRDRIRSYGDTMVGHTRHMVGRWDDGDVVGLRDELSRLTLRILAETLLGIDIRHDNEEMITRLTDSILEVSDPSNAAMYLPRWVPTPTRRRFHNAVSEFEALVDELLEARRGGASGGEDDLLGMMAAAEYDDGTSMDDSTIRDQLMTFLLAGHETSSLALSFAMFYLAQHDGHRERAAEEVEETCAGPPDVDDIPDLEWVEWTLREAMRRRPPAHALFREAVEPVTLDGYHVEAGTTLILSPYHIQNDERWYEDPEAYRPERWANGREEELPDYAYFPFGGGPRHCIGMRFAMLEMQLALATILRHVDFELVTDSQTVGFVPATTLRPDREIEVRITK
jgi:cytochrome P450